MAKENFTDVIMEAKNITKVYPGTVALKDVSFKIYTGKVNILIGENGAGKSTLMRILAGIEQPTKGDLYLNDEHVKVLGPKDAAKKGIGMIHQELNLYPELNVMQNIFIGQEKTTLSGLVIDQKVQIQKTKDVLKKLEHVIDPKTRVGDLRMGQQQIIEIAKSMVQDHVKILIMDEPTSSLSNAEVKILFRVIDELKSMGISIVYISHRMEEIMQVGDYVTVLRDGVKVAEDYINNIDISWIVKSMVGDAKSKVHAENKNREIGETILKVENLTLPSEGVGYSLENVSFDLHKGEILGIYGLLGSGRTELLECLMGMHPELSGDIYQDDKKIVPKSIPDQINRGFFLVPEDRKGGGLIHSLNIQKNITLSSLQNFTNYSMISTKVEDQKTEDIIEDLSIKVADKKLPIFSLSGGNQQKVVIGKGLLTQPGILLLDEPTRGIDVGAKEEVFRLIYKFAEDGFAVIVVASELSEILRVSDRIMVLSNGRLSGILDHDEATEQNLVEYSEMAIKLVEEVG